MEGIELKYYLFDRKIVKFDLIMMVDDIDGGLMFVFEYNIVLFKLEMVEIWKYYWFYLLEVAVENLAVKFFEFLLVNEIEK